MGQSPYQLKYFLTKSTFAEGSFEYQYINEGSQPSSIVWLKLFSSQALFIALSAMLLVIVSLHLTHCLFMITNLPNHHSLMLLSKTS